MNIIIFTILILIVVLLLIVLPMLFLLDFYDKISIPSGINILGQIFLVVDIGIIISLILAVFGI